MRIGLIAPPWITVPPTTYGGTEGVVDSLAIALQRDGHDVVLFTTGDSTCPVPRKWVYPEAVAPMGQTQFEVRHVQSAYDALTRCDVIHDHTTVGPVWSHARRDLPPVVTTIHTRFTPEARDLYRQLTRWGVLVNAISRSQRDSAPEVPVTTVIHHGIDPDRFTMGKGEGGYLLFLGRCAPEKGAQEAIEIARRAGLPLRIAAKMREPVELEYFERFVEPVLGSQVEFLGEIGPEQRDRELAGALALLNPITWDEPFGLVMIEALACGTPVVAFPHGAAPEIVEHGVTGFLVAGTDEAVSALDEVAALDRLACRRAVDEHFSAQRMTQDYLLLYREAIARREGPRGPRTRPAPVAVDALGRDPERSPWTRVGVEDQRTAVDLRAKLDRGANRGGAGVQ